MYRQESWRASNWRILCWNPAPTGPALPSRPTIILASYRLSAHARQKVKDKRYNDLRDEDFSFVDPAVGVF